MDWGQLGNEALAAIAPIAVGVLVTLISLGLKKLNAYLQAKTESELVKSTMIQIGDVVMTNVSAIEQEIRKALRDGKMTQEEQQQLKRMAIERVYEQAPKVVEALGRVGVAKLEDFISAKIEQAVLVLKTKV